MNLASFNLYHQNTQPSLIVWDRISACYLSIGMMRGNTVAIVSSVSEFIYVSILLLLAVLIPCAKNQDETLDCCRSLFLNLWYLLRHVEHYVTFDFSALFNVFLNHH